MKRFTHLLLLAALLLFACSKENEEEFPDFPQDDLEIAISSSKNQPGIGETDGLPLGTPWALPAGIRLVKRPHHAFDPDITKLHAHVNYFYVDVNLVNDRMPGTPPVTVEFPPGLIVVSLDHDKQNGISIGRYLINVPPTERYGQGRDTTTIYLGVACLNEKRSMPWYDNQGEELNYPISRNNYEQFVVTSDANLLKFLEVVKDKPKLKVTKHWSPLESYEPDYVHPKWLEIYTEIERRIWDITDGHGITQGDLNKLKAKLKAYE